MTTATTPYSPAVPQRSSKLRQMLTGAAAFDGAGGIFCIAAAGSLADWLSVPRAAAYVTGVIFLVATGVGAMTVRRDPLKVGWIVAANELFALWCVLVLAMDDPSSLGVALFVIATVSSAATGLAELRMARR